MSTLRRKSNWPAALALFLEEKKAQPFDWATNNCGFFACDWLAFLVGIDPAATFRPQVNSAGSAARVIEAAGGIEAIAEAAAAAHGWPEVGVRLARRGDIVSHAGEDGPALGVCVGEDAAFADKVGVRFRPVLACRKAWRIS